MSKDKVGVEITTVIQQCEFDITKIYHQKFTSNIIQQSGAQKPGLALAGYLKYLDPNQLQIFGKTEIGYLNQLPAQEAEKRLKDFMSKKVPGIIVSENQEVAELIISISDKYKIPILVSSLKSSLLIPRLNNFLYRHFTEKIKINGVMMDILGLGIFITGKSGIGKSEMALELVSKGHHLISDDLVEFYINSNDEIMGRSIDRIKRWIEVRGLGIINIVEMFGVGALLDEKKVDLVIELEIWDPKKIYDRLGEGDLYFRILGKDIPRFKIPVAAGRNLCTIIEVAVKYFIARKSGSVSFIQYLEQNNRNESI